MSDMGENIDWRAFETSSTQYIKGETPADKCPYYCCEADEDYVHLLTCSDTTGATKARYAKQLTNSKEIKYHSAGTELLNAINL
jgi:hypothetical protein